MDSSSTSGTRVGAGVQDYLKSTWNQLDVCYLSLMWIWLARATIHASSAESAQIAAVATATLWLRAVGYMNGIEALAAYVRMTVAIISDMKAFMLILLLLVTGNAFVLQLLYPTGCDPTMVNGLSNASQVYLQQHMSAQLSGSLFTSISMLYFGGDVAVLQMAFSPALATVHYVYYSILTPLIVLNLLIALMGGSVDRVNMHAIQAGRSQRAQLVQELEVLMLDSELRSSIYFPPWVCMFRPRSAYFSNAGVEFTRRQSVISQ